MPKIITQRDKEKAAYILVKWMADTHDCKISLLNDCDCAQCVAYLIVNGKKPHTVDYKIWKD